MLFVLRSPFSSFSRCTSVILIVSVDRAAASKVKSDTSSNERGREGEWPDDSDNEAGKADGHLSFPPSPI